MAAKLGFEAIEYVIRKFLTKQSKGIATIPGQKMKDKIKILVDKYAKQIRATGQDVNNVTVKQVQNQIDYGMTLKKQRADKAQALRDKAKAEYDYLTSEKYFEDLWKKSPEEIRELMRKQGLTPVEDKGIKSLKKKDPFQGWTPKIVPKETEAEVLARMKGMNKKTIERIKRRRYEAAIKAEKEKAAKDPNYIPDIIDPEDFASGGIAGQLHLYDGGRARVGMAGGGALWKFIEALFIKASNDIRLGKGLFKGLTEKQRIVQHDNLTKMVEQFQKTKKLPEGAEQYFGIDAEKAFKIKTGEIQPSFSLSREKLVAQFPNIPEGEINRIMKLPVDEQKKILTKLMSGQKTHTKFTQQQYLEDLDNRIMDEMDITKSEMDNMSSVALDDLRRNADPIGMQTHFDEITEGRGVGDFADDSSFLRDEKQTEILEQFDVTGKKGHAYGGIAGELHLNRPGYFKGKIVTGIKNYLRKKAADKKFMADLDKKLFDKKGNLKEGAVEKHFQDMTDDFNRQIEIRKDFLKATPPKGRKPNAEGGRVSYTKGGLAHVLGV